MNGFVNSDLQTAENRTWLFSVDELDVFRLDAPQKAKQAVADSEEIPYRNLRAKLVNQNSVGDTFVIVVEAL